MGQQVENIPITVRYGHDEEAVVMVFSRPVNVNRMTPEQARAMVKEIETSLDQLAAHQAKKRGLNG